MRILVVAFIVCLAALTTGCSLQWQFGMTESQCKCGKECQCVEGARCCTGCKCNKVEKLEN